MACENMTNVKTLQEGNYKIEIDIDNMCFRYRHIELGELRAGSLNMEVINGVIQVKYDPEKLGGFLPLPIMNFISGENNRFEKEINALNNNFIASTNSENETKL